MSQLDVTLVPQLSDNYDMILQCKESGDVAVVDCAEAGPVIARLHELNLTPSALWLTHHHWDHTQGVPDLIKKWPNLTVYGYEGDNHRLDHVTHWVKEGDKVRLGQCEAEVFFTPGHTVGHISYYFASSGVLLCGDVMFAAGCGRVFEGTFAQMHKSLQKLGALPSETLVYCAHEYTTSNVRFARSIDPNNPDLQQFEKDVKAARNNNQPTIPTTIGLEWKINPFLRVNDPTIQEVAKASGADTSNPASIFEAIRRKKDDF